MQDPRIETLVTFVAAAPDGASVDDIEQHLSPPVPRRTIQSWLAALVDQRRLRAKGAARATRYFARTPIISGVTSPAPKPAVAPHNPPQVVSAAGATPSAAAAKASRAVPAQISAQIPAVIPPPPSALVAPVSAPVLAATAPIVPDPRVEAFLRTSISRAIWACVKVQDAPQYFRTFAEQRLAVSDAEARSVVETAMSKLRNLDAAAAATYGVPGYAFETWRTRSGFVTPQAAEPAKD